MLRNLLTQLGGKYVHDVLINSPTFHRIVRKTHDTVKGIKTPDHLVDPNDTHAVSHRVKRFASIFKEEVVEHFSKKR